MSITALSTSDQKFLEEKRAVLITRDDLLPALQKRYDANIAAGKEALPIAVMVGQERPPQVLALPSGKPILVIGENDHRWTAAYIAKYPDVLGTKESFVNTMPKVTHPKILSAIAEFSKRSGLKESPIAVIEDDGEIPPILASAGAVRVQSGKYYILVGKSIANTPGIAIPQISHEFGHIVHDDQGMTSSIAVHNDPTKTTKRTHEIRADDYSAKLCQGHQSADNMEKAIALFKSMNQPVPPSPLGHPSPSERIPHLRNAANTEIAAGRCPKR